MLAVILTALLLSGAVATYLAATRLMRREAIAGALQRVAEPPFARGAARNAARDAARDAASALERSTASFAGAVSGADTPPLIALVGAPGADVEAAVAAAAAGAPEGLAPLGAPEGPARVAMTPHGVILSFGDDLLAQNGWRALWRATLMGYRRKRPDRPVDGVAFAIRAQVLARLEDESPGALSELGERFGALLQEAQAVGGLRLPVYLLVTGIEAEPGFAALRRAAQDAGEDDALIGWSAPGSPETPWDPATIQTAIAAISASLDGLALAALASRPGERSEAMLDMSSRVAAFEAPLRRLLTPMLRATAFADPMMFRGLYFVGGGNGGAGSAAPFAAEVFARKIFAESRLARPARGRLTQRARTALRLKVAAGGLAALGALGLFLLSQGGGAQSDLLRLLSVIDRSITENRGLESQGLSVPQETLNRETRDILNAMATLTINDLPTPLAPTSYLSPIESRIERAVATGLNEVALRALRDGLHDRFAQALATTRNRAALDAAGIARFAEDLAEFDGNIAIYDALRDSRTAEELAQLSNYAIGFPPPAGFMDAYEIYVRALSRTDAPQIDRASMRPQLKAALGEPDEGVFAAAYPTTPLFRALSGVSADAAWLLTESGAQDADIVGRLDSLLRGVDEAEALLADPEANWLDHRAGRLDQDLRRSAAAIAGLSFAPPGLRARLDDEIDASEAEARLTIRQLVGFSGRAILRDGPNGTELDPLYPMLRDAAAALLEDGRLAQSAPSVGRRLDVGAARLSWDPFRLGEAVETAGWLLGALTSALGDFPPDLREQMITVVRARTEARMSALVNDALRPLEGGGRDATRVEATSFAAAAPLLAKLRDQTALLGLRTLQRQLAEVADRQAARLLGEIDAELDGAAPYAPFFPGVDAWDGEAQSAPAMFGMFGDAELAGVVRHWRGFVQALGEQQAAPIVAYYGGALATDATAAAAAARWRDILATLSDYAARSPRNALSELERFIVVGLNELDAANCAERLEAVRPGAGWFGQQMFALVRALRYRCEDIGTTNALSAQGEIADAFDAQLAGRFPFVGVGGAARLADPSRAADAADPDSVRRFFSAHGAEIARQLEAAASPARHYEEERAREFTAALAEVRAFLGGPDGAIAPGGAAFAVRFAFRTNRDRERAGDQIVEWSAQIGAERLSSFEPPRALIWRQGDPIRLSFRWARNGPNLPAQPGRSDAAVEDRTLTLSYDDRWSLVTMVAANAPGGADLQTLGDPRPNVIRIATPLLVNPAAAAGAASLDRAELYMRVEIRPLDAGGLQAAGPALRMPVFPAGGPGR
ncbi:type VI secretion system protein [Rubrimonas cliftonensis]|nr:type VI secretion system protein [Rubrimonas cliftonensis]